MALGLGALKAPLEKQHLELLGKAGAQALTYSNNQPACPPALVFSGGLSHRATALLHRPAQRIHPLQRALDQRAVFYQPPKNLWLEMMGIVTTGTPTAEFCTGQCCLL